MPFDIPVPKPLIPLFRGGGLKVILDLAQKFGTGLNFINAISKVYPRDPSVPFSFYQQLTSYLSQFAKASLQAGDYLNNLQARQVIDNSVLPKNFFLKRPDFQMCNNFFRISYTSYNPVTGKEYGVTHGFWEDALTTAGALQDTLLARIQDELDVVASSARSNVRYFVKQGTLKFIAGVRLC